MIGSLLLRGMLIGILAGLAAYCFAFTFGEPQIDRAIAVETLIGHSDVNEQGLPAAHGSAKEDGAHAATAHAHEEEQVFSRETQAGLGMLCGMLVFGATTGGIFAMLFAFLHRRVGPEDPRHFALWLACVCFVGLVVVPSVKYPANPPSVGAPETIGLRTMLYFGLLVISITASAIALRVLQRLRRHLEGWSAQMLAVGAYLVIVCVACALLPPMNVRVPAAMPAEVLWQFRLSSFGTQLVLWATLGVAFCVLIQRVLPNSRSPQASALYE